MSGQQEATNPFDESKFASESDEDSYHGGKNQPILPGEVERQFAQSLRRQCARIRNWGKIGNLTGETGISLQADVKCACREGCEKS